jgi:ribosomal protein S18 acetylase RimI-like enzyme
VKIRPAVKADAPALAELVNYAGEGMPLYLWGNLAAPGEDPWQIGRARAERETGAFSYRNALVIQRDGECAGCLIGYPIPEQPGPVPSDIPAMFVPLQELENLAPDTWYINVLGVVPQFRNQGLGARLLEEALTIARSLGKRGVSLIVADGNQGARRLYERSGFHERASRELIKEDWDSESKSWLLLVREL